MSVMMPSLQLRMNPKHMVVMMSMPMTVAGDTGGVLFREGCVHMMMSLPMTLTLTMSGQIRAPMLSLELHGHHPHDQ